MKYILIIMFSYNGHGVAVDHIDYSTEASCEVAGKAFVAKFDGFFSTANYICVVRP